MRKFLCIITAPLWPAVLIPVTIILAVFTIIRSVIYRKYYYFRKDTGFGGKHKVWMWSDIHGHSDRPRFQLEISTCPHISYGFETLGDDDEGHGIRLTSWFGVTFFVTLNRIFPVKWLTTKSYSGKMVSWIDRGYGWSIHHKSWWFEWRREDSGMAMDRGFEFSVDFERLLIGKHKRSWKIIGTNTCTIDFPEGQYGALVVRKIRTDSWQRWPSKNRVQWEVLIGSWVQHTFWEDYNSGYYYGPMIEDGRQKWDVFEYSGDRPKEFLIDKQGRVVNTLAVATKFKETGVPIPGKGESSWDVDDTLTYSCSFGVDSNFKYFIEAAEAFKESVMKTRRRHGGENWIPNSIKNKTT